MTQKPRRRFKGCKSEFIERLKDYLDAIRFNIEICTKKKGQKVKGGGVNWKIRGQYICPLIYL